MNCSHITTIVVNVPPFSGQIKIKYEHVERLKDSIDMTKMITGAITLVMIKDYPDYFIFDGQHRLRALKKLIDDNPLYVRNDSIKGIEVNVYYIKKNIKQILKELFSSFNLSIPGNPIFIEKYRFSHKLAKIILEYLTTIFIKQCAFEQYSRKLNK